MIIHNVAKHLSGQASPRCWRPGGLSTIAVRNITLFPSPKGKIMSSLNPNEFQLTEPNGKTKTGEKDLYIQQVQNIKNWWTTPRFSGIRRPYSAEDVASKRGTLEQSYSSSLMAKKLFDLLGKKAASREPIHTSALFKGNKER